MKYSTVLIISAAVWLGIAYQQHNLAAAYVAVGVHVILYVLHAIEVKLNKLLDERGIHVSPQEITQG